MRILASLVFTLVLFSSLYNGIQSDVISKSMTIIKYLTILLLLYASTTLIKNKLNILIVCILVLIAVYYNFSGFNLNVIVTTIQIYSIYLVAYWIAINKKFSLIKVTELIYVTSFVIVIIGFIFLLFDFSLFKHVAAGGQVRYAGFYGNPIIWGFTTATLSLLSLYIYSVKKSKVYLFSTAITLLMMISSGTRGGALLVIAFVCFYFLYDRRYIVGVILSPLLIFMLLNVESVLDIVTREGARDVLSGRGVIWLYALNVVDFSFFSGVGFKSVGVELLSSGYTGPGYREGHESISIHNSYLDLLLSGGVFIAAILTLLLLYTTSKSREVDRFIFSYLASYLIAAFFESILIIPYFYSTFVFYLLLFYSVISRVYFYREIYKK